MELKKVWMSSDTRKKADMGIGRWEKYWELYF